MPTNKIKTRIAPSPTGLFHVGTARTALFNYLFAKQNDGEFVVRIEDTDKIRSKPEYEEDILNGLKWLGLNWDGSIVRQSDQAKRHLEIVDQLFELGVAYKKDGAIWFKVSADEEVVFKDLVRGQVSFKTNDLEDFVIVRSDGSPIFYLVGIVDDHDMGITHIIRGEDLLPNTPKQILISRALGYPDFQYAHLPLILNADRTKLSKRQGATSLSSYQVDYLPESLLNFLVLLGWHPSDDQEFFFLDELIKSFELGRVSKGGAIFDLEKLNSINNHYLKNKNVSELSQLLEPYTDNSFDQNKIEKIIAVLRDRLAKLSDFTDLSRVFGELKDYPTELLIFKKSDHNKTLSALKLTLTKLSGLDFESMVSLEHILKLVVSENDLTNGDVFWPIRVALSGVEKSPSPIDMLWVLGESESISRIEKAVKRLESK